MTYREAISYLYSRLPVFHRVGVSAYKPGLATIEALCSVLGNPHTAFRSVHVAGTNGKGSTSHLVASVLQSAGYRVGLFTSPHLKSFTERIRINGQPIPETVVAEFVKAHQVRIEAVEPSFYEVSVAMAFDYFAQQAVDIAVVEVGLGGRLDATNIITPLVSVITNIGWDHMDILGDTLAKIAAEKAGIIKPGVPVVIGESHTETSPVFEQIASASQSKCIEAELVWQCVDGGLANGVRQVRCQRIGGEGEAFTVELSLLGLYQLYNLQTVLTTLDLLLPTYPTSQAAWQQGIAEVIRQTGLKGRFQWLQTSPMVVADTAHNQPGIEAVVETVQSIPHAKLHIVLGFMRDKDVSVALACFPSHATFYFCQAASPRALPTHELEVLALSLGRVGTAFADVNAALSAALALATAADFILVTGSTYVVAELTNL
jgi:dihydrofolate synthase / folylpolyglutamate synthase